jgi:hypothetical protein
MRLRSKEHVLALEGMRLRWKEHHVLALAGKWTNTTSSGRMEHHMILLRLKLHCLKLLMLLSCSPGEFVECTAKVHSGGAQWACIAGMHSESAQWGCTVEVHSESAQWACSGSAQWACIVGMHSGSIWRACLCEGVSPASRSKL